MPLAGETKSRFFFAWQIVRRGEEEGMGAVEEGRKVGGRGIGTGVPAARRKCQFPGRGKFMSVCIYMHICACICVGIYI